MGKKWHNIDMSYKDTEFKLGDLVIHCREGLSTIVGSKNMGDHDYFLVKVNHGDEETIYVPCDRAVDIIRHLMDEKEADELLKFVKSIKKDFNPNTKQRRDAYKKRLSSGDVKEIAYLARQLYFYDEMEEGNKEIKLGPVDMDMLGYAESMIMDELALTYKKPRNEIKDFVNQRVRKIK